MIKIVTVNQMREIERAADLMGISYAQMMEHAGRAVAEVAKQHLRRDAGNQHVVVLVGPGNNGGDGLVAARILQAELGLQVDAYLLRPRREDDSVFAAASAAGVQITNARDDQDWTILRDLIASADILIDALLGTGARLPIDGDLQKLLEHTSQARRSYIPDDEVLAWPAAPLATKKSSTIVIAVDCPSGLNADTGELDPAAIAADVTVTFGAAKRGHFVFPGAEAVGELVVAGIGLPDSLPALKAIELELSTGMDIVAILPKRSLNSHKGTHGRAVVIAGSINYTGAAVLAGTSAYRAGAGLVTLAAPQPVYPILAAQIPEATWLLLPHNMGSIAATALDVFFDEVESYEALLVGPGLGRDPKTGEFICRLLGTQQATKRGAIGFVDTVSQAGRGDKAPQLPSKIVIDADGLNLLSELPEWWKLLPPKTVITPHPGEMARLAGITIQEVQADRFGLARTKSSEWGVVLVLKGAFTLIANPEGRLIVAPFATDALATAGTGDVLAGCIVGLMAQGMEAFDAAVAATYIHGLAGKLAGAGGTRSVIASDVMRMIPSAFAAVELKK